MGLHNVQEGKAPVDSFDKEMVFTIIIFESAEIFSQCQSTSNLIKLLLDRKEREVYVEGKAMEPSVYLNYPARCRCVAINPCDEIVEVSIYCWFQFLQVRGTKGGIHDPP